MSPPPTNPNTSCQLIRGEEKTPATADTNHHQIHNTTPTKKIKFQRFTITKIIIKHPCTNKITMLCGWFVHQPKIQNGNQG